MNTLSLNELGTLIGRTRDLSISIFMPVSKTGVDAGQVPIRFRNLLREAERRLVESGLDASDAERMLKPARKLLEDSQFRLRRSEGLAMFISPHSLRSYHVSLPLEDQVVVADHFYVEPLLPLLSADSRFYILAISMSRVRLIRGTHSDVHEVDLPDDMPKSLDDFLKYDDFEQQAQLYTGTPGWGGGKPGAVFFGHGVGSDLENDNITRYLHRIDKGLHSLLQEDQAPLVLAGVGHILSLYRVVSEYPHIAKEGIAGNPDDLSALLLHERAWAILEPTFEKARQEAIDKYLELAGTGQTSGDIKEIVLAAYYGRVATLFVATGFQQWGIFDPDAGLAHLYETPEPGTEDLLNLAAIYTLLNRGMVYSLGLDLVPGGATAAALFRY